MREKSEGNIWTGILVDRYIPFQASICNASLAVPKTLVGFTAVISRVLLPAIPSFLRLDSITLFALQNEIKIQLLTLKNWTVKCGLILFFRWFGLLQYVARYMLSAVSATTKHARLKKKNLFCLPDLLVAILSLFQHNNRMQNSRIFLVFPLPFLSFFLSFFSLRRGEGGGGERSWMWKGLKRAWIIARYYVCLSPELKVFIVLLEIEIQCDREIATTNGNLNKYRNKWTTLCISD